MNMTEPQQRAFSYRMNATSEDLHKVIAFTAKCIMQEYANAVCLISTDDIGRPQYVGIYDCEVRLNHLHNFHATLQPSPQLLGERIVYRPDKSDQQQLLLCRFDAWISAFQYIAKVCPNFLERNGFSLR